MLSPDHPTIEFAPMVKERPVLFSGPMIRALLAGTKTQTRRELRRQPSEHHWQKLPGYELKRSKIVTINERCAIKFSHSIPQNREWDTALDWLLCPYGQPGDRLWVREAWRASLAYELTPPRNIPPDSAIAYEAIGGNLPPFNAGKLRPGMFMPRWASRILLEVARVRVERLREISEADALAEGIEPMRCPGCHLASYGLPGWGHDQLNPTATQAYRYLWESINGEGSWDTNPWVWAIDFKVITKGRNAE